MKQVSRNMLVYTVKDRCRVCYTCVRECPVKAIKIINGQAEVVGSRCIACGNCVNVCSQSAKAFVEMKSDVVELLRSGEFVVAAIAPSFPAEFTEIQDYTHFVGLLKEIGFDKVVEVSFGADLVAKEYDKLIHIKRDKGLISSDCPAIVACIEQHHPDLISSLAPVVSPMVATSRVIRKKHGAQTRVVFIGPCIAKKGESTEIDASITFTELRDLFNLYNVRLSTVTPSEFDPPRSAKGAAFPVSHGLLNSMGRSLDITVSDIIVADGQAGFKDAIREFENGSLGSAHLELLCCKGCIMGPGMSKNGNRYNRRTIISNYVNEKLEKLDRQAWQNDMDTFSNLDLSREFIPLDQRIELPSEDHIQQVLQQLGKFELKDQLNCGACGYETCREHAIAIYNGLAETEMCLPFSIEKLHRMVEDLNITNSELADVRQDLKQTEKLATMGQLSAGIAHELNNPLGVITMYSNILKDEIAKDDPIVKDLDLIAEQADRCKKIVGGLLNFARKSQVNLIESNIVEFCRHSLQSIIKPDNVEITFIDEVSDPMVHFDSDQLMQVLTNLEKNAVEAMPSGGELKLEIKGNENSVLILISDTGEGIAKENMEKVFTPFFTTKGIGKGTGMGLPLVYGIIKMHRGQISVSSNADPAEGPTGTKFKIELPRKPVS
ncbi:MAG: 4Fe-4S dicluster domain-containing protein [Bacteroidetes bacterium]|nr:4Fe-4S dicluster domain-containing protein [Bacteroidota bacterium]